MNFEPLENYTPDKLCNPQAEACLLSILANHPQAMDAADDITPDSFTTGLHRDIFAELRRQAATPHDTDAIGIAIAIQDAHAMADTMAVLTIHDHSANGLRRYITTVTELHMARQLHNASYTIAELACADGPVRERIDRAQAAISGLNTQDGDDAWVDAHTAAVKHLDLLDARHEGHSSGMPTGLSDLDGLLDGGLARGNLVVIGARPAMGKAQPLTAKVMTSEGWVAMGELRVGDSLASIDGLPSIVTGVFPQGEKKTFRVTFTDGRTTACCDEHLWSVHHRKWDAPRVLSTGDVRKLMEKPSMSGRLWIDSATGDFGESGDLPLDPWLLGALLGDGDLTQKTIRFSNDSEQVLSMVRESLPIGVCMIHAGSYDWRLSSDRQRDVSSGAWTADSNPLTNAVRNLGLMGCKSATKFIPDIYKSADRDVRLNVLRGLMDTDGWVEKHGSVLFSSASRQLAKDAQDLARSLGYWCSMREKSTGYKKDGEYKQCSTAYVLTISAKDTSELFLFDDKRERCTIKTGIKRIAFEKIEESGNALCQCISVSHPTHLYITDDYVVTHNTALGMTIGLHMAATYSVGMLSMEMPHSDVRDRQAAILGCVPISAIKRPQHGQGLDYSRIVDGVERSKQLQWHVSDRSSLNILQVRSMARGLKRRRGLDVLIVDYIGLMAGLDSKQPRAYQIEEISRGLKSLAKELDIAVICLAQVNRGAAEKTMAPPGLHELRDSGAIEQDADVVAFIHRPIQANPDAGVAYQNYALLRVAKNRQGRTGDAHLFYRGENTSFTGWMGLPPTTGSIQKAKGFL